MCREIVDNMGERLNQYVYSQQSIKDDSTILPTFRKIPHEDARVLLCSCFSLYLDTAAHINYTRDESMNLEEASLIDCARKL